MSEFDFDAVVIGAGAVGLATGYALSRRGLSAATAARRRSSVRQFYRFALA